MIIEFACKTDREGTLPHIIGEVRSAFNLIAIALPPSAIDNYTSCPIMSYRSCTINNLSSL